MVLKIKIYVCKICNEAQFSGCFINNCKNNCDSWVCFDCISEDHTFRYDYDDDDKRKNIMICSVCENDDLKKIYYDKLINLINNLKISEEKKNDILFLLKKI